MDGAVHAWNTMSYGEDFSFLSGYWVCILLN